MAKKKSKFGSKVVADVERREKTASNFGYLQLPKNLPLFKEDEGTVKLDIIPYIVSNDMHPDANKDHDIALEGTAWYKRPVWIHHSVGPENETIVCPKTVGKKCPICEYRSKQFKEGVEKDSVIRKAQLRNLYIVIPQGHRKYDEDFHLWDISNGNFQELLDDELREDPELGDFPDPVDGKTLKIRFTEETFNKNKYYKATRIDFLDRKEGYSDEDVQDAPVLDELFEILPYKEIEMLLMGVDEEDYESSKEEVEEEDDQPSFSRRRKRLDQDKEQKSSRRRRAEVDEPEPEPEEEEEEPEEEPKSTRRRSRRDSKEETELEEETPKRTRRRTSAKEEKDTDECPEGFTFGKDWDDDPACDNCEIFEACGSKYEKEYA